VTVVGGQEPLAPSPSRRGRRRDPALDRRILETGRQLVEEGGLDALTVEALADRSGVPKSSIYRRWPSRRHLEAKVLEYYVQSTDGPLDTGRTRDDLIGLVEEQIRRMGSGPGCQLAMQVVASYLGALGVAPGDDDPVRRVTQDRRAMFRSALERGVARGELDAATDLDVAVDLLYGAMWGRVFSLNAPELSLAPQIVDLALRGMTKRGEGPPPTGDGAAPTGDGSRPIGG